MNNNSHNENDQFLDGQNLDSKQQNYGHIRLQEVAQNFRKYKQLAIKNLQQQAMALITRKTKFIQQVQSLIKAKLKFDSQDFYNRKYIYLVSKKWLQQWKILTSYQKIQNKKQISLTTQQLNQPFLCMNQELLDQIFYPTLKFTKQRQIYNIQHYNTALKPNLSQYQNYEYFSEQMWQIVNHYKHVQIKRDIISLPNSDQKTVQVGLQKLIIKFISKDILKNIKLKTLQELPTQIIQFSKFRSFAFFRLMTTQLILNNMSLKFDKQLNDQNTNLVFWFLNPVFDNQKLKQRVNGSLKYQSQHKQWTVCINGQLLLDNKTLQQQLGIDNPTILCEFIQINSSPECKICYTSQIHVPSICPNCRKYKTLEVQCKCNKIIYCTSNCLNSDIKHVKECPKQKQKPNGSLEAMQSCKTSRRGLVGLINLGNTCFMNSGLQCLSNTYQLTKYFINDSYISDINYQSIFGAKGNLTKSYSNLMKNLWCQNNSTFSPHQFKRVISSLQRMFSGYQQHDSGQFLCFLLNGLHEDINKVKKKVYIQRRDFDQRPEHIRAEQQWKLLLERENSKIVNLMYGQFRSQLDCPLCAFTSVQFDPFLVCSLPIPSRQEETILKIVFQNQENQNQYLINFQFNSKSIIKDLITYVCRRANVTKNKDIITYYGRYIFDQLTRVKDIKEKYKQQPIYAKVLSQYQAKDGLNVFLIVTYEKQHVGYTEKETLTKDRSIFRSYIKNFIIDIEDFMTLVTIDQFCRNRQTKNKQEYLLSNQHLASQVPFVKIVSLHSLIVRDARLLTPQKDYQVIKIQYFMKSKLTKQTIDSMKIHQQSSEINLMDCFEYFQKPEKLQQGNQWNCPKCKKKVQAQKQIMLYKSPPILIICLKRFKKKGHYNQKNTNLVQFPINNLDLTNIVINSDLTQTNKSEKIIPDEKQKIIYNLYAVSEHSGSTEGGHYVATCKNHITKKWYRFDDSRINQILQSQVVNRSAYILFYRRQ